MSNVKIRNVVASVDIHQKIDLNAIMKTFVNVDYQPKRFPGLVFKLRRPKTSTLIFNTGKMVITGAKKENYAEKAARKLMALLRDEDLLMGS